MAVAVAVGRAFVLTTSASHNAVAVLDMNSKFVVSVHVGDVTVLPVATPVLQAVAG
ncbi:MAG TPA: hypothetical protein VH084_23340 [Mycobacterium sp.]|nr:hypothetical protein [Mycobacterium sp.]